METHYCQVIVSGVIKTSLARKGRVEMWKMVGNLMKGRESYDVECDGKG